MVQVIVKGNNVERAIRQLKKKLMKEGILRELRLRESYEKQGQALMNMTRKNAEIEAEKAEYLAIFARHNLDMLAIKKPGLIENRFNDASQLVMEGIEDDTKELFNLTNPSDSD